MYALNFLIFSAIPKYDGLISLFGGMILSLVRNRFSLTPAKVPLSSFHLGILTPRDPNALDHILDPFRRLGGQISDQERHNKVHNHPHCSDAFR